MKRGCGFTLAMVAGIGLIALIAGGAAFQKINEQPWFCNTCHEMNFHYASWQASTHGPEARCLDCHAEPGVRGFIEEKVRGAEQLVAHITGKYQVPIRIIVRVKNDQCVACHTEAGSLPDTTVDARHDVHLAHQVLCADCHSRLVHNRPEQAKIMPIDQCDGCHQKHTAFPMVGKHATLTCTQCHVGGDYSTVQGACESCHHVPADHVAGITSGCATCHTPLGWKPAKFDHGRFPLIGNHQGLACDKCHAGGEFQGTSPLCESCHQLPANHLPGITGGCGECHTPNGWKPATFDHSFFPLSGMHTQVECSQCHPSGRFKGTSNLCESCHQVPADHPVGKLSNCQACHTPDGWKPAHFDHSRFQLTGVHRTLSCLRCHSNGVFQGLSTACVSCHNPPGTHAGLSTNCAGCHSTSGFRPSTFNHPQVGEHVPAGEVPLACSQCHQSVFAQASCAACHSSNNPGGD